MAHPSVDTTSTSIKEQLKTALVEALEEKWNRMIEGWDEQSDAKRKALSSFLSGLRNRLYFIISDMESDLDIQRSIALYYVEMQCQWTLLNLKLQHSHSVSNEVPKDLMYRAACISLIIESLESFTSLKDLESCCQDILGYKIDVQSSNEE